MSVLKKIAYFQNRRDKLPNKELAKEIAKNKDKEGIKVIVENLENKERNIQSDCIEVLYEVGYINPELITDYVDMFLSLLKHKNNRMIWGAMIALSTIAKIKSKKIWEKLNYLIEVINKGSVITVDSGIKTLSAIASTNNEYNNKIFPILIKHLNTCQDKQLYMVAENMLCTLNESNKEEFKEALTLRIEGLNKESQIKRLNKILQKIL